MQFTTWEISVIVICGYIGVSLDLLGSLFTIFSYIAFKDARNEVLFTFHFIEKFSNF